MSVPVWVLLGFAGWTLVTLFGSVGVYRWSRILTGRAKITEFVADVPHGTEWYRRAMRAHANCIENLPVYGAVVVAIVATGVSSPVLDALAVVLLVARICQTTVHVAFQPTTPVVGMRFAFFLAQAVCMFWMGIFVALHAS
ncbi:MAG: MAPEG family protein [Candidatus Binatia bacterium]